MKKIKTLFILIGLFIVLLSGFLIFLKMKAPKGSDKLIFNANQEEIFAVQLLPEDTVPKGDSDAFGSSETAPLLPADQKEETGTDRNEAGQNGNSIGTSSYKFAGPLFMDGFVKVCPGAEPDEEVGAVLHEDGTLWQVSLFENNPPVKIMENVIDIDVSVALKQDGSLWMWYYVEHDEIGAIHLMDDVTSMKSSLDHITAVASDGSLWAWKIDDLWEFINEENPDVKALKIMDNIRLTGGCMVIDGNSDLYDIKKLLNSDHPEKVKPTKVMSNVLFTREHLVITTDNKLYSISNSDQVEFIMDDVVYADYRADYRGVTVIIRKDGSLWVSGLNGNDLPDEPNGIRGEFLEKVFDKVKHAGCDEKSVYAIKDDGSLWVWGGKSSFTNYCIPRPCMNGVRNIQLYDNLLLTNDTLWSIDIRMNEFFKQKISDGVKEILEDGTVVMNDGTLHSVDYENDKFVLVPYEESKPILINVFGGTLIQEDGTFFLVNEERDFPINEAFIRDEIGEGIDKVISVGFLNDYILVLMEDKSFWCLHHDYNSSVCSYFHAATEKLLENVKDFYVSQECMAYMITEQGECYSLYIDCHEHEFDFEKVLDGVVSFYPAVEDAVLRDDGSVWVSLYSKESTVIYTYHMEDLKTSTDSYFIKKDNSLWVTKEFCIIEDFSEDKDQASSMKIMEDVSFAETCEDYGIAIKNDHTLWEFGANDYYSAFWVTCAQRAEYLKPRKLGDSFIQARITKYAGAALKADGTFWTWGDNNEGLLGAEKVTSPRVFFIPVDNTEAVLAAEKVSVSSLPAKCLDDIVWFQYGDYWILALTSERVLLYWGSGFSIGRRDVPYTFYPVRASAIINDPLIFHLPQTSILPNKEIDVLVKITDSNYAHNVRIEYIREEEIHMESMFASVSNYYGIKIPGISHNGVIKYRILADDMNGKTIETDFYEVDINGGGFEIGAPP